MVQFCRVAIVLVAGLYVLALGLFLIGTFGLFGAERDPLAGLYLILLGLPWNRLDDAAPEPAWPWLAALAPLVNLLILIVVCRLRQGGR